MKNSIIAEKAIIILKGGAGSGNWESPGNPRFTRQGKPKGEKDSQEKVNSGNKKTESKKESSSTKGITMSGGGSEETKKQIKAEIEKVAKKFPKIQSLLNDSPVEVAVCNSDKEWKSAMKKINGQYNPGCTGMYQSSKKKITMRDRPIDSLYDVKGYCTEGTNLKAAARHELGHHLLSESKTLGPGNWFPLFMKKGNNWFAKNVSEYAGSHPHEAFAESFSLYSAGKKLPKELNDWFDKNLGGK
jgi:hypothetical protein